MNTKCFESFTREEDHMANICQFVLYVTTYQSKKWNKSIQETYQIFQKYDIVDSYLIPYFNVMHTQDIRQVLNDIEEIIQDANEVNNV